MGADEIHDCVSDDMQGSTSAQFVLQFKTREGLELVSLFGDQIRKLANGTHESNNELEHEASCDIVLLSMASSCCPEVE